MNGWFSNIAEKSPLLALVLAVVIAVAAFLNSRDRYTATMALGDRQAVLNRIRDLEWRITNLQGKVGDIEVPPPWFEEKVNDIEERMEKYHP